MKYGMVVCAFFWLLSGGNSSCSFAGNADADAGAKKSLSASAFLARVRHPPLSCWVKVQGQARHRKEGKTIGASVAFRARFTPRRVVGQVIFGGGERYLVGQTYADGAAGNTVVQEQLAREGTPKLADFGLRPSDLTMTFLYWKLERELPAASVRGQACRQFILRHPDTGESVQIWISQKYLFPLRVYWFKKEAKVPWRKLTFTAFKKVNNIWVVKGVRIRADGWKTRVDFKQFKGERIDAQHPEPADLFLAKQVR